MLDAEAASWHGVDSWTALGPVQIIGAVTEHLAKASAFITLSAMQVPARSDNVCGFGEG